MNISSLEEGKQIGGLTRGQAQAMLTLWPSGVPQVPDQFTHGQSSHPEHNLTQATQEMRQAPDFCEILSFSRKLNSEAGLQKLQHTLNV